MKTLRNCAAATAIAAFCIASSTSQSASQTAPPPEALAAAEQLVAVFNTQVVGDTITNLTAQVWPGVESALREQNPKTDAATIAELRKEFERLMIANYAEVAKDAPAIYTKYFTAKEMQDLVAFYRSPLGAKTIRAMPQAMADLNAKTLPRLPGLQEKVYLAFLTVLQKRGLYAQ
jgi:hypothetical protein